ncbi:MAG: DUF3341 domain-containing protein [Pseudolabrys sp.]
MSALLVGDFHDAGTLVKAARWAKDAGYPLADAFSPFPLDGMPEILGETSTRLRVWMLAGGLALAALAYATEYWSAVFAYPIDSGGRPLHSWPAFVLFPFAVGIFGAALTGFIGLLVKCGLPRLHHPLFDINGFERVTQDRFMLALHAPVLESDRRTAVAWLKQAGAGDVWELEW